MRRDCTRMVIAVVLAASHVSQLSWAQDLKSAVPSEPVPPTGTTNYSSAKGRVGLFAEALKQVDQAQIRSSIDGWLQEHKAEIEKAAPTSGGVLVRVLIAQSAKGGQGEPRHQYFLTAFIAETGPSEANALAKYNREKKESGNVA